MRWAMRSRFWSSVSGIGLGFAHGAALDFLIVVEALEDGVDEDAGSVDLVGRELAEFDELFYFSDYIIGSRGHHGIEVARSLAIDEIAPAVALPRFDESEVATHGALENVLAALEFSRFFAFGNHGAVAGGCVKGGNAGAAGANAFGEGALRIEFYLYFAAQDELLEKFVFADVGGDHFFDLAILQEQAEAGAIGAGAAAGHGQIFRSLAPEAVG